MATLGGSECPGRLWVASLTGALKCPLGAGRHTGKEQDLQAWAPLSPSTTCQGGSDLSLPGGWGQDSPPQKEMKQLGKGREPAQQGVCAWQLELALWWPTPPRQ